MRNILIVSILLAFVSVSGQETVDSLNVEIPAEKNKKHRKEKTLQVNTTAQIQEEDPCTKGITDARRDAGNSDYLLIYNDGAPFTSQVVEILYEDYHIRVVAFSKEQFDFCRCYSEEMENLLSRHFGFSVFAKAEEKVRIISDKQNQSADTTALGQE